MARVLFRVLYGGLLGAVFLGAVWFGFRRSIVGRSVAVPELAGKTPADAFRIVRSVGLKLEEQENRARYDDRIPAGRVLLQQPEAGSLAKPAQVVRVVLSLGPRELRVPDLAGPGPAGGGAEAVARVARARAGLLAARAGSADRDRRAGPGARDLPPARARRFAS